MTRRPKRMEPISAAGKGISESMDGEDYSDHKLETSYEIQGDDIHDLNATQRPAPKVSRRGVPQG